MIHLSERRRSLRDTMHGDARKRDNLITARRLLIWRNVNQPIGDCFEPALWLVDNPDVFYWDWI